MKIICLVMKDSNTFIKFGVKDKISKPLYIYLKMLTELFLWTYDFTKCFQIKIKKLNNQGYC